MSLHQKTLSKNFSSLLIMKQKYNNYMHLLFCIFGLGLGLSSLTINGTYFFLQILNAINSCFRFFFSISFTWSPKLLSFKIEMLGIWKSKSLSFISVILKEPETSSESLSAVKSASSWYSKTRICLLFRMLISA